MASIGTNPQPCLMSYKVGKTFKINPETGEETTRTKRYGNTRKKKAIEQIKERRRQRKELGGSYDEWFEGTKYNME